ncbi:MAG: sigma factor [Acidobacteriota bacterium]
MLAHALAGRQDHFAELYQRRQGPIYRFVLQMSGSTALAEDVTQETFLMVLTPGRTLRRCSRHCRRILVWGRKKFGSSAVGTGPPLSSREP